jgi:nucleotide-binding universal stress UspA family protein
MFRKILIANDLSDASRPALRMGLEVARRFEAEVTVLYVAAPHYPANHWYVPHIGEDADMLRAISDREQEAARAVLERNVREALPPDSAAAVKVAIEVGVPADVILEQAAAMPADLVVVGTHARGGVERLLVGSVAGQVARKAHCSVLTVHAGEKT